MTLLHEPVLFDSHGDTPSVFDVLVPKSGDRVLDCTLGLGGHAKKFCELVGPTGEVIGLDADLDNQALAVETLKQFENFSMIHANFEHLALLDLGTFDIIFADLGISSPHFDDATRGFSFRFEGPLDLRLDRSKGKTAAELLQKIGEEELFRIFADLGEFSGASKLAKTILEARDAHRPIDTTTQLKTIVEEVFSWKAASVLPQVFQALRMAVNNEMGALTTLISSVSSHLHTGGRTGIISFHSLEDRLVKQAFKQWSTAEKDEHTGQDRFPAAFRLLTKKPIVPSEQEVQKNPRSRSAKFRAAEKLQEHFA